MAERKARRAAGLGPGLHAGKIEMVAPTPQSGEQSYRVKLFSGQSIAARLSAGVCRRLAEECLREGKTVVLVDTPSGVEIAGALQTQSALPKESEGTLALEAKHIRVRADQSLLLEVPGASLQLEQGGALRMEGDKLVIDMAALMRVFAARMELP